ncbi:hypothetical protein BDV12DRAFT_202246 [Aspergillus spectabilis]
MYDTYGIPIQESFYIDGLTLFLKGRYHMTFYHNYNTFSNHVRKINKKDEKLGLGMSKFVLQRPIGLIDKQDFDRLNEIFNNTEIGDGSVFGFRFLKHLIDGGFIDRAIAPEIDARRLLGSRSKTRLRGSQSKDLERLKKRRVPRTEEKGTVSRNC